ncbi:MAG TPA: zinc ribbon domain-containing protein [Pyrinomonadaceae bacterium]|nr:zinc ribbon domain-containing protein [Pyrinomonadaceae bacterium]
MAGTAVSELECGKCGVEVREGSTFCYNCGEKVPSANGDSPAAATNASGGLKMPAIPKPSDVPPPVPRVESKADPLATKLDEAQLKPAPPAPPAKQRRRTPRPEPRMVEVVWEERQQSWGFIIGAAVLVFLSLIFVILAFYLR